MFLIERASPRPDAFAARRAWPATASLGSAPQPSFGASATRGQASPRRIRPPQRSAGEDHAAEHERQSRPSRGRYGFSERDRPTDDADQGHDIVVEARKGRSLLVDEPKIGVIGERRIEDAQPASASRSVEIVIEAVTALTAPISLVAAPEMIAPVP